MSKFLKSQTILLKILSLFGFFAFNCQTYERTYSRWIYCYLFNVAANIVLIYMSFYYIQTSTAFLHDGSITKLIHIVEFVINLITTFIIVMSTLIRYDGLIKFLKALEMIELQVQRMRISSDLKKFYERLKFKTNVAIIFSITFNLTIQIIYVNILMANEPFMHKLTCVCYDLFSFHFSTVSLFIFVQLKTLEKFCKVIKENLKRCMMHSCFCEKEIGEIYKIIFDVQDLMDSWNYFNGFIVFAGYIYIFGSLTSELYFTCVSAIFTNLIHTDAIYYIYNACNLIWCLPMITIVTLIGKTCTKISEEIENCMLITRSSYDDQQRIKEKFLMHLENKKFTANDFFIIDDSMIFKVLL